MAELNDVATNEHMLAIADTIRAVSRTSEGMTIPEMPERLLQVRVVEYNEIQAVISALNVSLGTYDTNIKHLFLVIPNGATMADKLKTAEAEQSLSFNQETGELSMTVGNVTEDTIYLFVIDLLLSEDTEESAGIVSYQRDEYLEGEISALFEDLAGKGDNLDYTGNTLSLKSGDTILSQVTIGGGGGGGGTYDYNELNHKPKIDNVELIGNKTALDLGLVSVEALENYYTADDVDGLLEEKQDTITDLSTIRTGAGLGATAVQPATLDSYSTTEEMNEAISTATVDMATQTWVEEQGYALSSDIPTKTSDLTNDSGFITCEDVPTKTSDLINDSGYITSAYHDTTKQDVITDLTTIRSGASLGSTAVQPSAIADMATKTWTNAQGFAKSSDLSTVATSGSYNDLSNKPTINSKTISGSVVLAASDINATNLQSVQSNLERIDERIDDVYTKDEADALLDEKANSADLADVATSGSYDDLSDTPDIPSVIDNVTSTATNDALSAKQGKLLNDRINNIEGRGRYLSHWNCVTGLPLTNPSGYPYIYRTGDFFIVNTTGTTNYIPNGSEYTGQPSTTVYAGAIKPNDTIYYDGTNWSVIDTPVSGREVQDVYQNGGSVLSAGIAYVTVPEATSDLINDSGFITGVDSEDVTDALGYTPYNAANPSGYQTSAQVESAITGKGYTTMSAVEAKGYAVASDLADVATSGSYNDLDDKPTIPTALSQLTDDATHRVVTDTEKASWNAKAEVSDIPTKTSDLTNDSDFVTGDRALLIPVTTPTSHELVGINTSNAQTRITLGEGLTLANNELSASGGFETELLWENADPSTSFAGQLISVTLTDYKFILIEFNLNPNPDTIIATPTLIHIDTDVIYNGFGVVNGKVKGRVFGIVANGVSFNPAISVETYGSETIDNTNLIPYRIWGIK